MRRLIHLISLEEQFQQEERPLKSEDLGDYLNATGDSIRKDLSLGLKGEEKSRSHYGSRNLSREIRDSLGLTEPLRLTLVGLGNLGVYLLEQIPRWKGVSLEVIFDSKMNRLERLDQGIPSFPAWEIPEMLSTYRVTTAILASDAEETEKNAARLIDGGIRSILNLSGYYLNTRMGAEILNVNLLTELLTLSALSNH